jgi:transcriptional regulator with XRE-family HTH domain
MAMHTDRKRLKTPENHFKPESVGDMLRSARKHNNLNIHELAKIAGVSAGMISQIERGTANPSVNTISKLAQALELRLGLFFEEKPSLSEEFIVRKGQRRRIGIPDPNFIYELLTPDLEHALEFVWVESAPGASTEESPFSHEGEECGIVLQGTLEVHLGDGTYLLQTGDSIIFNSKTPHWYRNPGPKRVLSVWAITPPTF